MGVLTVKAKTKMRAIFHLFNEVDFGNYCYLKNIVKKYDCLTLEDVEMLEKDLHSMVKNNTDFLTVETDEKLFFLVREKEHILRVISVKNTDETLNDFINYLDEFKTAITSPYSALNRGRNMTSIF